MNAIDFHRAAIAFHQAEIDKLTGTPGASGFDPSDWRTWWPAMLEQFKNDGRPHPWRDPGFGVPITETGDNDPPDEEFLRKFKPFMDAATREKIEDSTGAIFFLPNVKKRTGLGWEGVKAEVRRLWFSAWGQEWRANELNRAAGLVPDSDP